MIAPARSAITAESKSALLDGVTPVAAYSCLRSQLGVRSFLLESAASSSEPARYSVIGLGALGELTASDGSIAMRLGDEERPLDGPDLLAAARLLLGECAPSALGGGPRRFVGGYAVASFELASYFEQIGPLPSANGLPDFQLIVPEAIVVFDHRTHVVTVTTLANGAASDHRASEILAIVERSTIQPHVRANGAMRIRPLAAKLPYRTMVERAQEAIASGEAFQIVLSQAWLVESACTPFEAYRALRSINPSPYMFFMDLPSGVLLGSSPEALCRLDGHRALVRPLAGTRARCGDEAADARAEQSLRADEKERAEHVMLVDLGRNDLGRVCEYGSVNVGTLLDVERYSHVMHLVSEITGVLRPKFDAFDLFAAAFPAGTVSGAPKIRALQLIAQLEGRRRGTYAGSVGYFGFDGSMDACITLRSAFARDGAFVVQAGAGIVAGSDPAAEDAESERKAEAMFAALRLANGGSRS